MPSEAERAKAYLDQRVTRAAFRQQILLPKVKGSATLAKGLLDRTKARRGRLTRGEQ